MAPNTRLGAAGAAGQGAPIARPAAVLEAVLAWALGWSRITPVLA